MAFDPISILTCDADMVHFAVVSICLLAKPKFSFILQIQASMLLYGALAVAATILGE